jgi:RIO-like serine/threonine protein kinase
MILLEPANTITHCNVEIKRRTISLTGFSETKVQIRGLDALNLNYLIERDRHDAGGESITFGAGMQDYRGSKSSIQPQTD